MFILVDVFYVERRAVCLQVTRCKMILCKLLCKLLSAKVPANFSARFSVRLFWGVSAALSNGIHLRCPQHPPYCLVLPEVDCITKRNKRIAADDQTGFSDCVFRLCLQIRFSKAFQKPLVLSSSNGEKRLLVVGVTEEMSFKLDANLCIRLGGSTRPLVIR